MFLRTAAIVGAILMIVGSLGTIPLAWKSRGTNRFALWVTFILVAAAIGVSVIANQTGLLRDTSYTTLSLILALAYVAVRVAMLKRQKENPRV